MGIKNSPECTVCVEGFDSNVHMLLECRELQNTCLDVQSWIQQLAYEDFTLTNNRIIMGDLETHHKVINLIILNGNVCIHLTRIREIAPNFFFLKTYMKRTYDTEKYKATINNTTTKFDKEWAFLKNFWDK